MKLIREMTDHPKGKLQVFEDEQENIRVFAAGREVTQKLARDLDPERLIISAAQLWDENNL